VSIEEDDPWVVKSGYWEWAPADGFAFWSQGRAIRAAASGASLNIETHCQSTHDIYVGTSLDSNCGIVQASLDGGTPVTLDCYGSAVQVHRKLFGGVTPGQHGVILTLTGNKNTASQQYVSRLRRCLPGDERAPIARPRGPSADQDVIWLNIGGTALGKTVFPAVLSEPRRAAVAAERLPPHSAPRNSRRSWPRPDRAVAASDEYAPPRYAPLPATGPASPPVRQVVLLGRRALV
jgi:hypothetical protein